MGLAAARRLARSGAQVTVLEAGAELGGLVVSLEVGGTPLERFYHHVFPPETELRELVADLGLAEQLEWLPSSVGVLTGGRVWPFTGPLDLLRFGPLPPLERVRTGIGALRLARTTDWSALDRVPARDWLAAATGTAARDQVWDPLLRAKFGPAAGRVPAAWMYGRFAQRRGAREGGREVLGYLHGGFKQVFDALAERLPAEGVDLRLGVRATKVATGPDGAVTHVETSAGDLPADAVLWTGALPNLARLVAPDQVDERWTATGRLGVVSVVLETDRALTDTYWINVCDDDLPFTAVVEHTNLLPPEEYGGRHVVYLARYFTDEEEIASRDPEEVADDWVAELDRVFPGAAASVLDRHVSRAAYAAPLVELGHLRRLAPVRTHVPGLYAATTAQIYPHDRGMDAGLRLGARAADLIRDDLGGLPGPHRWRCPVCGGDESEPLYESADGSAVECGLSGDALRPSADAYGALVGPALRCTDCGHGSLAAPVPAGALDDAYADAADPVSLRERAGQVETARRALALVERHVPPRPDGSRGLLVDLGCWTGSFLEAARERGWDTLGVEPSRWASQVARDAGLDVRTTGWEDADLPDGQVACVVMGDVLEHLEDPGAALAAGPPPAGAGRGALRDRAGRREPDRPAAGQPLVVGAADARAVLDAHDHGPAAAPPPLRAGGHAHPRQGLHRPLLRRAPRGLRPAAGRRAGPRARARGPGRPAGRPRPARPAPAGRGAGGLSAPSGRRVGQVRRRSRAHPPAAALQQRVVPAVPEVDGPPTLLGQLVGRPRRPPVRGHVVVRQGDRRDAQQLAEVGDVVGQVLLAPDEAGRRRRGPPGTRAGRRSPTPTC